MLDTAVLNYNKQFFHVIFILFLTIVILEKNKNNKEKKKRRKGRLKKVKDAGSMFDTHIF